jgi:hypothetical protein
VYLATNSQREPQSVDMLAENDPTKKTMRKFQSHLYVSYGITTVDIPCRSCNF